MYILVLNYNKYFEGWLVEQIILYQLCWYNRIPLSDVMQIKLNIILRRVMPLMHAKEYFFYALRRLLVSKVIKKPLPIHWPVASSNLIC